MPNPLQTLVDAFIDGGDTMRDDTTGDIVASIVQKIEMDQASLLNVVEALGGVLTSDEPFERAKGDFICVLAPVVTWGWAASVLLNFFLERLHDQPSVGELAKGLLALLNTDRLTKTEAASIAMKIFDEINLQTYQQSVRNNIYRIIDGLMEKCRDKLQADGAVFVSAYIQAMDGEKDPRNLVIAFRIVQTILAEFDIGDNAEDICNVLFAYFPITFKPPPGDPHGITTEDLRTGLRDALIASPAIAEFALPALLEKLASSNQTAKILKSQNDSVEERDILQFLRSITKAFSTGLSSSTSKGEEMFVLFIKEVLKDCLEYLKEPESKLARIGGKILRSSVAASDPACNEVVRATVPQLLKQLDGDIPKSVKNAALDRLVELMSGARDLYGTCAPTLLEDEEADYVVTPFSPHKDQLRETFTSAIHMSNPATLRVTGLHGIMELELSRDLLSTAEQVEVIQLLNQSLVHDNEESVAEAALECLAEVGRCLPSLIMQESTPLLFTEARACVAIPERFVRILASIEAISTESGSLTNTVLPQLISLFFDLVSGLASNPSSTGTASGPLLAVIGTVQSLIQRRLQFEIATPSESESQVPVSDILISKVSEPLLESTIGAAIVTTGRSSDHEVLLDREIVENVANVVATAIRRSTNESSEHLTRRLFAAFVESDTASFIKDSSGDAAAFHPLTGDASESAASLAPIFLATVSALPSNHALPVASTTVFLNSLVSEALATSSLRHCAVIAKIAAVIVNKWDLGEREHLCSQDCIQVVTKLADGQLSASVSSIRLKLEHMLDGINQIPLRALVVYTWLARALVVKSSQLGMNMAAKLLDLIGSESHSTLAMVAFGTLLNDFDDVISKDSSAVIKASRHV
ncbi:hypothetical protein HDU93_009125 [Gonapodya sp. JEL0774]|nr:hypothetical protein HDU93_009125 [Gonapodya sp. JEL0774]